MATPFMFEINPIKTYKTKENAINAVEKVFANASVEAGELRYFVETHNDGRYFPVFVGTKAVELGIHFHFNIIA